MEANPRIDSFIQDLLLTDEDKGEVLVSIRDLVLKITPNVKEEIKYGGLVYIIDKRLFCGIFVRKNHISVEFDRGAEMHDPDNYLEGSGRRRHLKILQEEDVINKKTEYYINQSCTL